MVYRSRRTGELRTSYEEFPRARRPDSLILHALPHLLFLDHSFESQLQRSRLFICLFFTPKCFGVYFLRAMCHADAAQISDQKTAHWLGLVIYRVVHIRFQQL